MPTSVRTKSQKKQSSTTKKDDLPADERAFEQSLLALENACFMVLETRLQQRSADTQKQYWRQSFINIANPVSLALMEYKGPRHFHYHYRHREHDESILHPVLENPVDMLAMVCKTALAQCRSDLVGLEDKELVDMRKLLEVSLNAFLHQYETYSKKV